MSDLEKLLEAPAVQRMGPKKKNETVLIKPAAAPKTPQKIDVKMEGRDLVVLEGKLRRLRQP